MLGTVARPGGRIAAGRLADRIFSAAIGFRARPIIAAATTAAASAATSTPALPLAVGIQRGRVLPFAAAGLLDGILVLVSRVGFGIGRRLMTGKYRFAGVRCMGLATAAAAPATPAALPATLFIAILAVRRV